MSEPDDSLPPILRTKRPGAASVFEPQNLIREARRQLGLGETPVPAVNVLDPDGDILRYLKATGQASRFADWPCYHSELFTFEIAGQTVGIVGCAVGAPYAVLIAEQMFCCGAELVISITSSGQLKPIAETPYYVLVERARRDEGTSYHYLPPGDFALADAALIDGAAAALAPLEQAVVRGATWTTDAPFRETADMIAQGTRMGLAAIEMESAALYALATAKGYPIVCLAHVTNTMAVDEGDFEKGEAGGALDSLALIGALADAGPRLTAAPATR